MDVQLMAGLIVGGAATFTSLLIVGVQMIFYTKSFEEEYADKVKKIKFKLKTTIDSNVFSIVSNVLNELLKIKGKKDSEKIDLKKLPEETINQIVKVNELNKLIEVTGTHNEWCSFIVRCKSLIRKIGVGIILSGLTVLISFIIIVSLDDFDLLPLMFMALMFIGVFIWMNVTEYSKCLKKADTTYEKLESGLEL